jgi:hypothetical protein
MSTAAISHFALSFVVDVARGHRALTPTSGHDDGLSPEGPPARIENIWGAKHDGIEI